jgi:hypothetical protein
MMYLADETMQNRVSVAVPQHRLREAPAWASYRTS